ncbi:hypothetical protein CDL12_04833 [Handroanthus impetiginosus]|uniref:Uncharacterized protein n=1 Tax=Handroanthus impetiginosus TaxID=429701 RepID=A0A2G9HYA4_9LAMI|nr:hypothetical protein CDL12_04833 [Handroanthus impetiginosus]
MPFSLSIFVPIFTISTTCSLVFSLFFISDFLCPSVYSYSKSGEDKGKSN